MGLTLPLRCLSPSCRKLRKVWVTEIESKPGDRLYIEELISLLLGAKPDPLRTVPTALPHTPPHSDILSFFIDCPLFSFLTILQQLDILKHSPTCLTPHPIIQ